MKPDEALQRIESTKMQLDVEESTPGSDMTV